MRKNTIILLGLIFIFHITACYQKPPDRKPRSLRIKSISVKGIVLEKTWDNLNHQVHKLIIKTEDDIVSEKVDDEIYDHVVKGDTLI